MNKKTQLRLFYILLFVILVLIEVFIGIYVHDKIIRPYVGDIIIVVVIYCFIKIILPQGIKFLPLYIFLFALTVELLQSINIVSLLNLENIKFIRILIGTSFDWKDIICYFIGCLLITVMDGFLHHIFKNN